MIKLSVVVCTYNREDVLLKCLDVLAGQIVGRDDCELVIINNNSTDKTHQIVEQFIANHDRAFLFLEEKQGLSNARNRGGTVAKGEYVAFIDDDTMVDPGWLNLAMEIVDEHKPDIFGGPVYPILNGTEPAWFKQEYGIRGDMGETGWIRKGYIVGTNFFIRRELLNAYGGFNPELGMKGDMIGYHEETEIVKRAFRESRKVFFSRELIVRDILPEYKFSILFYMVENFTIGYQGVGILESKIDVVDIAQVIAGITSLFNSINASLRISNSTPETYMMDNLLPEIARLGRRVRLWEKQLQGIPAEQKRSSFGLKSLMRLLKKISE